MHVKLFNQSSSSSDSLSSELDGPKLLILFLHWSEQRHELVHIMPDFWEEHCWLLQSFLQLQQSCAAISFGHGSVCPWIGWYLPLENLHPNSSGFISSPCHSCTCGRICKNFLLNSKHLCNWIHRDWNLKYLQVSSLQMNFSNSLGGMKAPHVSDGFSMQISFIETAI